MESINIEYEGIIEEIYETQEFPSGFRKKDFVVLVDIVNGDYKKTEYIKASALRKAIQQLDQKNIGDKVKEKANLVGNKSDKNFEIKYFSSVSAWDIE